ncbi:MAG: hypothetical protein K8L99_07380 [Anaerolineae bacterium]|nr:hypothetical protein [Anaerolineae bacterium]
MEICHIDFRWKGVNILKSPVLGYPRFDLRRALKRSLESFWKGQSTETDLLQTDAELRHYNWQTISDAGINWKPLT